MTLTHCGVRSTNLTLAASGTYTILVHDGAYASTTTSYGLSIQSFTGGGCNGTPIACGQTISNAISLPTKSDSYTYAGNAGETLVFSFVGYGNCYSFGNNAVLDLYNPAGQKIVTLTHCGVRSTNLTLATSGTYTILIHDGAYASPTTSYGVSIQSFTGGGYNQTPIVCGQAISNAISLPTKSDSYSYAGNAGQTLVFSFVGYGNCYSFGNNAVLDLYNPVGQKIATLDHCGVRSTNLTLATSGNYTILVHDSVYASPTASYAVSVQSFTGGGCNGTPIVCGQTISNNLSLPAQARSHGFATGGGLVIFSFGGFAGVQFDLYAPTGNKLFTRTPGTATNITLAAGAYTLLVHDGNYANIGAYSFSATCIGTPCNYTISPGGILVGPGATNGTVAVAASSGCAWSALASASWLMITGVSGASGNGTVSYAVEANTSANARVGILTVQGLNFTVNQAGVQVFAGQDIGDTSVPGSSTYSNGVYTLRGSGEDIEGTADAFHFAHLPLAGDGQIIARIVSLQAPQAAAEVGVMFRETLDSGSKHAFLRLNMGTNAMFRRRLATDIGSRGNPHTGTNISWLRLMRMGDTFVGFTSSNGLDWNYVWFSTVNMSNQVRVGLAITAHHNGQLAEARVDNVAIGKLTPLSGNWPETSTRIHLGGEPMGWDGMQPIGGFKMLVRGAIGEQLRLRFSSDATTPVASWSVLGTVTNKLGAVIVLDSQAPVNPLKFYAAEKMAP